MLVFGFDIGTTSVGSAVVRIDVQRSQGSILRLGARIFPEARDPDGTPLNQQRRAKRMMRRQLRRRRQRRKALNGALSDAGLLPRFGGSDWQKIMKLDPYALRKKGVSEVLSAVELGRALYHLAKRRHFKARDLKEDDDQIETSQDEKKEQPNREETVQLLKSNGLTLGQWLADRPERQRKRGVHATRDFVAAEFDKLWQAQSAHNAQLRDPAFRKQIEQITFFQRPVFWRKATLGQCPLEPSAELCPQGSWLSQQRRMLEKLNNLAIAGGNSRSLDATERAAILATLQTQGSMSWSVVRKALEPLFKTRGESAKAIKFNLELGGDEKLLGNPLEAKLTEIFGAQWSNHVRKSELRREIHRRLWAADYGEIGAQRVVIRDDADRKARRRAARDSFVRDFGVTDTEGDALAALKLPQGWERYSTEALEKMLPMLERGVRFGALLASPEKQWVEWRDTNFPNRVQPTGEFRNRLPSPSDKEEMRRLSQLRNPTVVRIQNELRKVLNNLIGLYGKPDLIRVELTREVGLSKKERKELDAANRKRERRRKDAEKDLVANGFALPSRDDIEKWLLWEECGKFDPYSGRSIGFDDLFKNNVFQVEHIWPRPISLDNSFANKTLCHRDWNQRKAKRTPFEAFGGLDEWQAMKDRVWKRVSEKAMPKRKAVRFCWDKPLPEDFTNRQLNDTGWAARAVVKQLKTLWPDLGSTAPVTVQPVTGRVTAHLRRLWQLNNILSDNGEKTRADHRHHAVDALVVACAHPGVTQVLSRYWQAMDDPRRVAKEPSIDPPWPTIRQDAEKAAAEIVVSHRVRKKVSGPLHSEMPFGYTGQDVIKNGIPLRVYVKRVPVEQLSVATLKIRSPEEITRTAKFVVRDEKIRKVLLGHLEITGDPEKAYPPYPRVSPDGPEIRKVRVLTTRQENLMVPVANGHAESGNNHHIAVVRKSDGTIGFEVVSLFEAMRRLSKHEPVVRRSHNGAEFVMSLAQGEAVIFPSGDEHEGCWVVVGISANGQIQVERGTDADHSTFFQPRVSSLVAKNVRKVSIDPIGRIWPAYD